MTPGLFVLLGISLLCISVPALREWYKRQFSHRWPVAAAECKRGNVTEVIKSAGEINYDAYRMTAFFSYKVENEIYEGEYTEDFRSLSDARQILSSLKNGPLYVRYNPAKPWDNVLNPYRDLKP